LTGSRFLEDLLSLRENRRVEPSRALACELVTLGDQTGNLVPNKPKLSLDGVRAPGEIPFGFFEVDPGFETAGAVS